MISRLLAFLPWPLQSLLRRTRSEFRLRQEGRRYRALGLSHRLPFGLELQVRNRSEWLVFNDIFVSQTCDGVIAAALGRVRPGDQFNFLDLGANVGFFSARVLDLAIRRFGAALQIRGILVEGSPQVYADLTRRLSAFPFPNVQLEFLHGLVGKRSGLADFYESSFHIGNSLTPSPYSRSTPVAFVDVEALLAPDQFVHLLKCDIEGAEQDFLENYPRLLQKVVVGFVELHHATCDPLRCLDLLQGAGFTVEPLREAQALSEYGFSRPVPSAPPLHGR